MPPLKDVGDRSMSKSDVEVVSVKGTAFGGWVVEYRYLDRYWSAVVTAPDEVGAIAAFYKRKEVQDDESKESER